VVYDKKTWATKEIINVEELNHIEQGVADAHVALVEMQAVIDAIPDTSGVMLVSVYDPDEDGKVNTSVTADTLANGGVPKSYNAIALEIDTDIATHASNGSAHHVKYTNSEAVAAINADTTHGSTATHNYRTDEEIQDVCASLLVAGSNVTLTYDDVANTLAVASTGMSPEDKSKLDGIESGATADLTGDEIITLINASSSIIDADNVDVTGTGLTSEQLAKLNGIETGATADQTASEIINLINASALKINAENLTIGSLATPIERGFIGEVVPGDSLRIFNPRVGTILSVTLISSTLPVSENLMVDVRKNGIATTNSIFASDTPMILATNSTLVNGVYKVNGILDAAHVNLVANDILRVYVTQAGSAVDVSVCIEVLY